MRIFLYCFFLIFPLLVNAQDIMVKEFTELPNDLAARTHEKLDANGNSCCLLKVILPKQDVIFEGWVIEQKYTPGEYWVYVPEGTTKIKIKHCELNPLQYEFPQKLESKHTYLLKLEIKEIQKHYAYFKVKCNVKDCILYISNQKFTTKKGLFEIKLSTGNHDYTLCAEDEKYEQLKGSVTITEMDTYKNLNATLKYTEQYIAEKNLKKEKRKKFWNTVGAIGVGAVVVGSQVLNK